MLRSPRRPPLRARCHSACSSGVSPEPRDPTLETVEAASRARKVVGRCTSTVPHLPLALQPQRHVRSRARRGSEAELVFIARIHERDSARALARGVSPPLPGMLAVPALRTRRWRLATGGMSGSDTHPELQRPDVRARGLYGRARACRRAPSAGRVCASFVLPPTSLHRRRAARCRGPCTSGRPTRRGARSRGRSA